MINQLKLKRKLYRLPKERRKNMSDINNWYS